MALLAFIAVVIALLALWARLGRRIPSSGKGPHETLTEARRRFPRYDRKLWIVESVTPAAYPSA